MPLIRDYIAEHERSITFGREALRAVDRGDLTEARRLLDAFTAELTAHWRGEENGLFAVMVREELYAEHINPLIREHRELADLLARVDIAKPTDQQAIRDAIEELYEHISKEEDGIFPASLTALGGDEWDAAIEAWHDAHPGQTMTR